MEKVYEFDKIEFLERIPQEPDGTFSAFYVKLADRDKPITFDSVQDFAEHTIVGLNNWFFLRRAKLLDREDEEANQAAEKLYYIFKSFNDGQISKEDFLKSISGDFPKVLSYVPVENFGNKFKETLGNVVCGLGYEENFLQVFSGTVEQVPVSLYSKNFKSLIENYICIRLFRDVKSSVLCNLEVFNAAYEDNMIKRSPSNDRLKLFYDKITNNPLGEFFREDYLNQFKGIKEDLYDAFKEMQLSTFTDVKKSLYCLDEKDVDKEKSERIGVKVYEIGKQPEKMLLHVTTMDRSKPYKETKFTDFRRWLTSQRDWLGNDYISLSYIDNSDIKTFRPVEDYVTVIFGSDIPDDHLITISDKDAFTEKDMNGDISSRQIPFYHSAEKLLENTKHFNEIAIIKADIVGGKEDKPNTPIAIFCHKQITENDIKLAKCLNLPIIHSTSDKTRSEEWMAQPKRFSEADHFELEL